MAPWQPILKKIKRFFFSHFFFAIFFATHAHVQRVVLGSRKSRWMNGCTRASIREIGSSEACSGSASSGSRVVGLQSSGRGEVQAPIFGSCPFPHSRSSSCGSSSDECKERSGDGERQHGRFRAMANIKSQPLRARRKGLQPLRFLDVTCMKQRMGIIPPTPWRPQPKVMRPWAGTLPYAQAGSMNGNLGGWEGSVALANPFAVLPSPEKPGPGGPELCF